WLTIKKRKLPASARGCHRPAAIRVLASIVVGDGKRCYQTCRDAARRREPPHHFDEEREEIGPRNIGGVGQRAETVRQLCHVLALPKRGVRRISDQHVETSCCHWKQVLERNPGSTERSEAVGRFHRLASIRFHESGVH